MRVSRSVRTVAAVAALGLALTACGGSDDGGGDAAASGDLTTVVDGELTVCSEIPYAPFEFEDENGEFTGFDIDLVRAISEELGLELSVVNTGFEGIQSGAALAAKQCDLAASAMTITEEREENLDFTDAYFDAGQSLLVTADSEIGSLADTDGLTIGVQADTTGLRYAEENKPEGAELTEYTSGADAITALQAGQVDAVLQDLPVNVEAAQNDDSLTVIEEYSTGEEYGFAVAEEGAEALLEAVNAALQTLRDNGTYDDIYDTYFTA